MSLMSSCAPSVITISAIRPRSRRKWRLWRRRARRSRAEPMRHAAVLVLALCCAVGLAHGAESDLQRRQAAAQRDQDALRERIRKLEKEIGGAESSRQDVSVALKESETAISELDRRLELLAADSRKANEALKQLRLSIEEQTQVLATRQAELADQLRAQYAGGLSPWAALLSGEDPQDITRDLGYLDYVSRAQAKAVRGVRAALDELAKLRERAQAQEQELQRLAQETTAKRAELDAQRAERLAVLERIDKELKQQRGEAERLARNEQRLGELVDALGVAIEQEAEARRRAEEARRLAEQKRIEEEKRLAEERRLAEEKRLADERRLAEEKRLADAKRAAEEQRKQTETQRLAEAEQAQPREPIRITGRVDGVAAGEPAPSRPPRITGVETSSARAGATDDGDSAADREAAPQERPTQVASAPVTAAPAMSGLSKGLRYPVKGEVQGRFGMERPEGGVWRGIVLRAQEGVRVSAVAPGRVVYAGWLGGFGNLM